MCVPHRSSDENGKRDIVAMLGHEGRALEVETSLEPFEADKLFDRERRGAEVSVRQSLRLAASARESAFQK